MLRVFVPILKERTAERFQEPTPASPMEVTMDVAPPTHPRSLAAMARRNEEEAVALENLKAWQARAGVAIRQREMDDIIAEFSGANLDAAPKPRVEQPVKWVYPVKEREDEFLRVVNSIRQNSLSKDDQLALWKQFRDDERRIVNAACKKPSRLLHAVNGYINTLEGRDVPAADIRLLGRKPKSTRGLDYVAANPSAEGMRLR